LFPDRPIAPPMPLHECKRCPRCGGDFECRSGTILRCQCEPIRLEQGLVEQLALRYGDCLCATCLHALKARYEADSRRPSMPVPAPAP
jgi:hypothetical protein